ncbi:small proline-rich protein 2H-like [Tachyglossus aculeatus]|uniref:small proline-rich protein 2H-like n=1 Tax=Tachyglossus aculeatus TaxID=9261 RepID=UPI0018F4D5FA|nr:small proline-rich protein 2H-like [Tachyglossus aculeatus]
MVKGRQTSGFPSEHNLFSPRPLQELRDSRRRQGKGISADRNRRDPISAARCLQHHGPGSGSGKMAEDKDHSSCPPKPICPATPKCSEPSKVSNCLRKLLGCSAPSPPKCPPKDPPKCPPKCPPKEPPKCPPKEPPKCLPKCPPKEPPKCLPKCQPKEPPKCPPKDPPICLPPDKAENP